MNWGYKLMVGYLTFVAGMGYMVYRATHVDFELVQSDYYKTELKYQDVIDASKRTSELSSPLSLTEDKQHVNIQFPNEMKNTDVEGTAWFYCAYDQNKDRHIPIKTNKEALQQIDIKTFAPGNYVVKFNWTSNNKSYYIEKPITIL